MSIERKAVLDEVWMSGMIGCGKYSVDNFFGYNGTCRTNKTNQ